MPSDARSVRLAVRVRRSQLIERRAVGQRTVAVPRGRHLDDIALAGLQPLLQEHRQIDLADETDALRILAGRRSQVLFGGDPPNLRLQQVSDRKQRARKLPLGQLTQEITLVFVRVAARQQTVYRAPVDLDVLAATVVTRSHVIGPQVKRRFQEGVELDFAVAKHVRVRRPSPAVLGKHIVHDAAAVFIAQVDQMKRDVEPLGHQFGEHVVVVPRAIAFERPGRILPVAHEKPHHIVSLLLEQVGRHARIDASGEAHHYPHHITANFSTSLLVFT